MKRTFNHTKRPVDNARNYDERDFEWEEELEYIEGGEDYAGEESEYYESTEGYAEDEAEYESEYYESAEGYAEDEAEYYESAESYAGDETEYCESAEGYAEGEPEYYESTESYAEDEAEYCKSAEGYAEGEAEYYESTEGYAGGEPEYGGNVGGYAGEEPEYVGDFTENEDLEVYYEDTEIYNAEYNGEEPVERPRRKKKGFWGPLKNLSLMDKVIAVTGVAVFALALATGAAFVSSRIQQAQVSDFISVGTQLKDIALIGEDGLIAVADARIAKLKDANATVDGDGDDDPNYEENEYERKVTVSLNMTSIQKDLKIKFTNQKTDKLVAHVPFSVKVTDPNGKTSIWSDDDMDGIIYKKDITPGTYEVVMESLTDQMYADYTIPTDKKSVVVKKDISYKKVDVANEVKTEKEIDAKKEDTVKKDTEVESALKDTVAWVESKKISATYTEVAKSTVPDPLKMASLNKDFMRMGLKASQKKSCTVKLEQDQTLKLGEQPELKDLKDYITIAFDNEDEPVAIESVAIESIVDVTWSGGADIVELAPDGTMKGVKAGKATVQFKGTAIVKVKTVESSTPDPTDPTKPTESTESTESTKPTESTDPTDPTEGKETGGTDSDVTPAAVSVASISAVAEKPRELSVEGSITVEVTAPAGKTELKVDKKELSVVIKGTVTSQVTPSNFAQDKKLTYKVVSDKEAVATATVDESGKVTVTGVSTGKAQLTVTANYADGGTADTAASATIDVTVGVNKTIELDKKTATAYLENQSVLNAFIKGSSQKPEVTAISSDASILKVTVGTLKAETDKVSVPIILEALKEEGSVTVTVTCKEDGEEVKATCTVTVKPNPRTDSKTELKDEGGRVLYVLEDGKYKEAKYADYYKFDKFYVKGEERYTGWQTLNGKVYFFKADGTKVTGEQVIQGAKYTFASDGSLVTGSGTVGIDVSKWNGTIDWNQVKNSGISYVIIRCGYRGSSQGKLVVDPKYEENIQGATKAGLKVGVYFFTQAVDEREAVEEASMVLEQVKKYKISYPIFLDVEASGGRADSISKDTRTAVCKAFCETIQNAGYTAGIYANKSWLTNKLDAGALSAYKIWLAQYADTPTYTGRYDLWQYRSTGKVSGISGNVDMNQSYLGY